MDVSMDRDIRTRQYWNWRKFPGRTASGHIVCPWRRRYNQCADSHGWRIQCPGLENGRGCFPYRSTSTAGMVQVPRQLNSWRSSQNFCRVSSVDFGEKPKCWIILIARLPALKIPLPRTAVKIGFSCLMLAYISPGSRFSPSPFGLDGRSN